MKYGKRSEREKLYVRRIIKQKKVIQELKSKIMGMKMTILWDKGIIHSPEGMLKALGISEQSIESLDNTLNENTAERLLMQQQK